MKLADIPLGSDLAYRRAAKTLSEEFDLALETCRSLYGIEPEKLLLLMAETPDWSVFLEEEDEGENEEC